MYKIYKQANERWWPVIDMKLSKTESVPRVFMSMTEVNGFIQENMSDVPEEDLKIEEIVDGEST